jgi:hypothetical protein
VFLFNNAFSVDTMQHLGVGGQMNDDELILKEAVAA